MKRRIERFLGTVGVTFRAFTGAVSLKLSRRPSHPEDPHTFRAFTGAVSLKPEDQLILVVDVSGNHILRPESWHKSKSHFLGDAQDDFRSHLSLPMVTGCPITMADPKGTTFEFMFVLKNRNTYGKILLTQDTKRIYIFSAHLPLKANLSCE